MPSNLLEKRRAEQERVLKALQSYSRALRASLGPHTLILYGSYARGDFNSASDIDVIIVSMKFREMAPLERYEVLPPPPLPQLQAILWTPEEALKLWSKPAWRRALEHSIVINDDLGITQAPREQGQGDSTSRF